MLTVSISLTAQTWGCPFSLRVQPAFEMLHPQFLTLVFASSSSSSRGSEKQSNPSVEAERRVCVEPAWEKWTAVMSSEWVEVCFRRGAAGFRRSLKEEHPIVRHTETDTYKKMFVPV